MEKVELTSTEMAMDEFINEVHKRLLGKLYDLGQTDSKMAMFFIPIMGQIKSIARRAV